MFCVKPERWTTALPEWFSAMQSSDFDAMFQENMASGFNLWSEIKDGAAVYGAETEGF